MSQELDQLQEIARVATRKALEGYVLPESWRTNLTLGTEFRGDERVFELYVAGERPQDAIVIASATVNRRTLAVQVTVSNLSKAGE
jgi:hypothetical protein